MVVVVPVVDSGADAAAIFAQPACRLPRHFLSQCLPMADSTQPQPAPSPRTPEAEDLAEESQVPGADDLAEDSQVPGADPQVPAPCTQLGAEAAQDREMVSQHLADCEEEDDADLAAWNAAQEADQAGLFAANSEVCMLDTLILERS